MRTWWSRWRRLRLRLRLRQQRRRRGGKEYQNDKKTPSLNPSKPPPKSLFPLAFISIWAQKNRFNFPNITPGMRQEVILHHNNTTQECRMDTMTAQRFCFSSQKETTSRFYPVHRIGRLNSAFQLLLNTICGSEKLPRLADSRVAIV